MSVATMQYETELRDALEQLREAVNLAGGFSWHQDALYLVECAALAAIRKHCVLCEARPGDNEYCSVDGEPHAWITTQPNRSQ